MIKTYIAYPSASKMDALNTLICEPNDKNFIKGCIQIVHGMTEHIDRYEEFAEYFTSRGYVIFGNDIIGHGRSNNKKTASLYLSKWEHAVQDIYSMKDMIRKRYPDKPIILLGFSLGSFLVRCMPDLSDYAGRILIGTGYQPSAVLKMMRSYLMVKYHWSMQIPCKEIKKLAFDSYNSHFKHLPKNYWLLTSEQARCEYDNDNLVCTEFTPQFFCEFLRGMTIANNKLNEKPTYIIPHLIISGEKDPVGGFGKGVRKVYDAYREYNVFTNLVLLPNKTHDVLHDTGHEDVYKQIEKFVEHTIATSHK